MDTTELVSDPMELTVERGSQTLVFKNSTTITMIELCSPSGAGGGHAAGTIKLA